MEVLFGNPWALFSGEVSWQPDRSAVCGRHEWKPLTDGAVRGRGSDFRRRGSRFRRRGSDFRGRGTGFRGRGTALRGRGSASLFGRGSALLCGRGSALLCGWGGASLCGRGRGIGAGCRDSDFRGRGTGFRGRDTVDRARGIGVGGRGIGGTRRCSASFSPGWRAFLRNTCVSPPWRAQCGGMTTGHGVGTERQMSGFDSGDGNYLGSRALKMYAGKLE